MTIIEFYDSDAIENVAGTLTHNPERMILVGYNARKLERRIARYQKVLGDRGVHTELSCISINRNDLNAAVTTLSTLVETYDDCVFDLAGGEEIYMVAVGILLERYGDRVGYQRFVPRTGTWTDGEERPTLELTVDEYVRLYGGRVVTDTSLDFYSYDWKFDDEFDTCIETVWDICRKDPRRWNVHATTLGFISEKMTPEGSLSLSFSPEEAFSLMRGAGIRYCCDTEILHLLAQKKLILDLHTGETVSFTFRNEQTKRFLIMAGQALELIIALRMRALREDDGAPLYHDVRVGVVIDWDEDDDGDDGFGGVPIVNEIDVLAIKDGIPVFVSCKNGTFDANELYKLRVVAREFGGTHAKCVLVATALEEMGARAGALRERMQEMEIRLIENPDEMTEAQMSRILRSLWSN